MSHQLQVLLDGLASPDPTVRDGWAYEELAQGIEGGRFDGEWPRIRATALAHLDSGDVQARTFAPLVLTWLVVAGDRDRGAFDAVARWYSAEADTRGHDDRLGWLHAVAHGADYLGECARAGIATGPEVLSLLAARLLGPGPAWRDQEDARVAHAAVLALGRCGPDEAATWLAPVTTALDAVEGIPDPLRGRAHLETLHPCRPTSPSSAPSTSGPSASSPRPTCSGSSRRPGRATWPCTSTPATSA